MSTVGLILYRATVVPAGLLFLFTVGLILPKIREGLKLRRQKRDWPAFERRPLWIHASSGEFEYAKPLITALKAKDPNLPIVVTYFSPTYAKQVGAFPGVDFSLPLPLDLPGPLNSFLKKLNPEKGLIARTDLWPELLEQCRRRDVPLYLFSATSAKPLKSSSIKGYLKRSLYEKLSGIFCVSADDLKNLKELGVKAPVSAIGDTRYDQVMARLKSPRPIKASLRPSWEQTLVAGSTWPQDEEVLIKACAELLKRDELKLVLVPHEPTPAHIQNLKKDLQSQGIAFQLYSQSETFTAPVLLVDQMGILAELYQWGAFAFVGGSFKKSVHSVMEPLAAGAKVYLGPYHQNNREALEFQKGQTPGVFVVKNAAEISSELQRDLQTSLDTKLHQQFLLKERVQSLVGATTRLLKDLNY